MTIFGVLIILLFLISLIAFIYGMVKACKTFGALQTTMLYFFFFSTWAFLVFAAGVHDKRISWTIRHHKAKAENLRLQAESSKLKYGDLTSTALEDEDNALIPLVGKVNRLTMDRGRVWRGLEKSNFTTNPELLTIRFDSKQIANGDPGELKAKENVEKLVVYVFAERLDPTGRVSLPYAYLGEFVVEEVQGQDMRLKPTLPLLANQSALLSGEASMLTIFELMPLDSHDAFATDESKSTESEIFGHMDPQTLSTLLNIPLELAQQNVKGNLDDPNVRMSMLLRSYLLDGQEAPEDAPPESVWTQLEFTGEHTIDVDSKEQRNATDGGYYDPSGKTVDARLKRDSAEVKFQAGKTGVFGREAAEEIIKLGVAKAVKRVFVRPLNNYEFGFRDTRQEILQVDQQKGLIERENKVIGRTNAAGQEQIRIRSDERQKLDKDLAQVQKEQAVASSEVQRLEADLARLKREITAGYQQLKTLHASLKSDPGMMVGTK